MVKPHTIGAHERRVSTVATNLAIDPCLIDEAKALGGHKTKTEAVTAALREYIRWKKHLEFVALFGTVEWDEDYDYKAERRKEMERDIMRRQC